MLIIECGKLLSGELDVVDIVLPEGTPLAALAGIVKDMADAYTDDGKTFFLGGDRVNALAAFYYGYGWLHFGLAVRPAFPSKERTGFLSILFTGRITFPGFFW